MLILVMLGLVNAVREKDHERSERDRKESCVGAVVGAVGTWMEQCLGTSKLRSGVRKPGDIKAESRGGN